MPTFKTYTAPTGDLPALGGRRATREDFSSGFGGAGKGLQKFGETILADTEEQESRKALIASSEIRAKYARALDEAALTGGDTAKLKEQMQDDLAKVGEEFVTRKGTQSLQFYTSNTELMFDEQSNHIRITRAAANARLEGQKFLTSTGEIIRSNPDYLATAEKDATAFVATLKDVSPEKKAEIEQGLKLELNMAAAIASARLDPQAAKKRLEAGEWTLTPEQREAATQKADSEIRARRAEDAYLQAEQDRIRREANDKARDKHFAAIMGGTATRRSLMDEPDFLPQTREHMVALMEARAKELTTAEKRSDPATMRDLWMRVHAPDGDPRKIFNGDAIFEAVQAGRLNTTDANQLNALVANQKDENNRSFGTRLQGRVTTIAAVMRTSPEFQAQPELAAAIQLELISRVEKASAALRRENKDPSVLIDDPDHKDYMFKPGIIKAVAEDVKQRMQDAAPKIAKVDTQEAYDALEPGTAYIDSKGNRGIKKGARKAPAPAEPTVVRTGAITNLSDVAAP